MQQMTMLFSKPQRQGDWADTHNCYQIKELAELEEVMAASWWYSSGELLHRGQLVPEEEVSGHSVESAAAPQSRQFVVVPAAPWEQMHSFWLSTLQNRMDSKVSIPSKLQEHFFCAIDRGRGDVLSLIHI